MTLATKCQESSYLDEKFSILLEWCKPSQVEDIFSFSYYKQESSFILPSPSPPYPHSVHHQPLSGWPSQHIPTLLSVSSSVTLSRVRVTSCLDYL